jgi:GGDEF domain-containing protein
MMILLAERVEPDALDDSTMRVYGEQGRDLALVETADDLRRLAGPAVLVARLSHSQFGLAALDTLVESLEEVRLRLHAVETDSRLVFGSAVFHPQEPVSLDVLLEHAMQGLHPKVNNVVA